MAQMLVKAVPHLINAIGTSMGVGLIEAIDNNLDNARAQNLEKNIKETINEQQKQLNEFLDEKDNGPAFYILIIVLLILLLMCLVKTIFEVKNFYKRKYLKKAIINTNV